MSDNKFSSKEEKRNLLEQKRSRMKEIFLELTNFLTSPDVNKDEAYKSIGEFIVKFSNLETLLKFLLDFEAQIQSPLKNQITYLLDVSIVIRLLKELYSKKFEKGSDLQRKFMGALNECHRVNEWRVRVAHGMWILEGDQQARTTHFSRQSLEGIEYFGELKEIRIQTAMVEKAYKNLLDAVLELIDSIYKS